MPQLQASNFTASSHTTIETVVINFTFESTNSSSIITTFTNSPVAISHSLSRFLEPCANNFSSSGVNGSTHNGTILTSCDSVTVLPSTQFTIWRYSSTWTVALCSAYLIVFFLGLVGNISVLWVIFILRRSTRHSMFASCNKVFNGLIGNLAFADLLVIIFCLPATLIGNIFTPWILGRFVCKAVPYLQGVSVSASVYTLVAISIDRFYGIYYPFNNGFSPVVRRTVIIFIWVLSFIIAIPWMVFFDLVPADHFFMCQDVWPNDYLPNIYFLVVNLGLQYLIPLSIIVIFYMLLFVKIWHRKIPTFHAACHREISTDTVDQWNARIVEQSKIKVFKMLIAIVSLFALSWLPLYLIFIRLKFGSQLDEFSFEGKLVIGITPLAQWLGASNSCVNPILYFFFNAKFRAYLKKAITRNLLCSSSLEYTRNQIYYNNYHNNGNNKANQHNHQNGFQTKSPHPSPSKSNIALNFEHSPLSRKASPNYTFSRSANLNFGIDQDTTTAAIGECDLNSNNNCDNDNRKLPLATKESIPNDAIVSKPLKASPNLTTEYLTVPSPQNGNRPNRQNGHHYGTINNNNNNINNHHHQHQPLQSSDSNSSKSSNNSNSSSSHNGKNGHLKNGLNGYSAAQTIARNNYNHQQPQSVSSIQLPKQMMIAQCPAMSRETPV